MTYELRCGECSHWLGESSTELVRVGVVARGPEAAVEPPRDLRLCKSCGKVNVYVPRSDLEARLAA